MRAWCKIIIITTLFYITSYTSFVPSSRLYKAQEGHWAKRSSLSACKKIRFNKDKEGRFVDLN